MLLLPVFWLAYNSMQLCITAGAERVVPVHCSTWNLVSGLLYRLTVTVWAAISVLQRYADIGVTVCLQTMYLKGNGLQYDCWGGSMTHIGICN